jgi:hypothetical protein
LIFKFNFRKNRKKIPLMKYFKGSPFRESKITIFVNFFNFMT